MPNEFKNTYVTHFLPIKKYHQLSELRQLVKWPDGLVQAEDGALKGKPGLVIDGFKEVKAGFYVPCIQECSDRLHAVSPTANKTVEYRCGSRQADKHLKVITCKDCEACPFRKGRGQ